MLNVFTHESGLPAVDAGGDIRVLACLPTDKMKRMAFAPFSDRAKALPLSELVVVDHRLEFGDEFVLNQASHGSCTGFMAAGMTMKGRALAGQTFAKLSGAFVYSFVNGGRDNGASIGDTLDVLIEKGVCLESEAGWDAIYPNRIPKPAYETAKRFKALEAYRVEEFDEAATAIQLGYVLGFAVHVGGTFDRLDSEDVVGLDRGPGNHAVHACGLYKSNKWGWCLDCWNSWTIQWGNRGRFRVSEKHWDGVQQDAYAIRASEWDPQDPKQPPVVAG